MTATQFHCFRVLLKITVLPFVYRITILMS